LTLPVIVLLFAIGAEVVGVFLDHLALTQWTREVARSAAVSPEGAEADVSRPERIQRTNAHVDVSRPTNANGEVVEVTGTLPEQIDVPVLGISLFRHELRVTASMWVEHAG
jgi:hypothetical protein